MSEHRAAQIYAGVHRGVVLSDADVKFGREFYRELADKLGKCGPVFKLAAAEASYTARILDGFYHMRDLGR